MKYTCHSGGCPGSDMAWELVGKEYGVKTIAYSFDDHIQYGENQKILNIDELGEGWLHVVCANEKMKRRPDKQSQYVKFLLCRNWFQVKNSESVFAIGMFIDNKRVKGGTGWAVQMAIDNKKPVYVFDQVNKKWNTFNYETEVFDVIDYILKLTENFAGIGTREITNDGLEAIHTIFKKNFNTEK
jgi:hypothetical protein